MRQCEVMIMFESESLPNFVKFYDRCNYFRMKIIIFAIGVSTGNHNEIRCCKINIFKRFHAQGKNISLF
jgi:hypothetical protein